MQAVTRSEPVRLLIAARFCGAIDTLTTNAIVMRDSYDGNFRCISSMLLSIFVHAACEIESRIHRLCVHSNLFVLGKLPRVLKVSAIQHRGRVDSSTTKVRSPRDCGAQKYMRIGFPICRNFNRGHFGQTLRAAAMEIMHVARIAIGDKIFHRNIARTFECRRPLEGFLPNSAHLQ